MQQTSEDGRNNSDSPAKPKANHTIRPESQLSQMSATDVVKDQIALKYDQMDLERKLAEMCKSIGDFQRAYEHPEDSKIAVEEPQSQAKESTLSQRSARSHQSRSPPRQIKARYEKAKIVNMVPKHRNQNTKIDEKIVGADILSSEADQTMINSETEEEGDTINFEEQTFRPVNRNQGKSSNRSRDLPLQSSKIAQSSHATLIREKNFYEQRHDRREKECKEVMNKRDKQPYQDYAKDLEDRSRENLRKARFRN